LISLVVTELKPLSLAEVHVRVHPLVGLMISL
jgi:hypothetical protein